MRDCCGAAATGLLALLVLVGVGCGDDGSDGPPAECLSGGIADCDAIVWTDYQAIWDNRLVRCGSADTGPNCHSAEGQMGGLVMADADGAHDALLGGLDGRARVIPGDPACSELVKRIESADRTYQMPPNDPMSAAERCSIIQWIEEGAER